ncbi:hypothetical protein MJ588_11850 [Klebsiella pneumoniae]|nr:hypothetical protein MJ588_11850 [Klebsiella pneumoniae]
MAVTPSAPASRQRHAADPGVFSRPTGRRCLSTLTLPQALAATLVSTLLSVDAGLTVYRPDHRLPLLWPGEGWQRLSILSAVAAGAVLHVALPTAALLLFAEGGRLWHRLPVRSVRRSLTATVSGLA